VVEVDVGDVLEVDEAGPLVEVEEEEGDEVQPATNTTTAESETTAESRARRADEARTVGLLRS
jgi:hypothetical protein